MGLPTDKYTTDEYLKSNPTIETNLDYCMCRFGHTDLLKSRSGLDQLNRKS